MQVGEIVKWLNPNNHDVYTMLVVETHLSRYTLRYVNEWRMYDEIIDIDQYTITRYVLCSTIKHYTDA